MENQKKLAKIPYKRHNQNQYVCTSSTSYADTIDEDDWYNHVNDDEMDYYEYWAYMEYCNQDGVYE